MFAMQEMELRGFYMLDIYSPTELLPQPLGNI